MPDCGEQQLVFHIENMEQPSATARPYKTDRLNWFSDNLCIFFLFFSLYCRKRKKTKITRIRISSNESTTDKKNSPIIALSHWCTKWIPA